MTMKKLIINQEQFKRINEAEQNDFNITANIGTGGVPEINKALDNPELNRMVQQTGIAPKFIPSTYKGPNGSTTVEVQADGAGDVGSLPPGTPNDAAIVVKQPNLEESYTKRGVEEMRIAKIKENGRRFTKKALKESLFSSLSDDYIDKDELAEWCLSGVDFLYYLPYNPFGDRVSCANSSEIQQEIANDIRNCDYLKAAPEMSERFEKYIDSDEDATVVKLCGVQGEGQYSGDYYVLWEKDA